MKADRGVWGLGSTLAVRGAVARASIPGLREAEALGTGRRGFRMILSSRGGAVRAFGQGPPSPVQGNISADVQG